MLAAYLICCHGMPPRQAITQVRTKRPYSIETHEQEEVLWDFADHLEMERRKRKEEQTTEELPSTSGVKMNGCFGNSKSKE